MGMSGTYRVAIDPVTNKVEVMCFDVEFLVDHNDIGTYDSMNETPLWIQERIAVLMITDPTVRPLQDVAGVGRRIDRSTYWVYHRP
tara:strand:- start:1511 stop:1768 length:258 start_codon:yes stop_codon:yes gene_type:complete